MEAKFVPLCMTAAEHKTWLEAADALRSMQPSKRYTRNPCSDCTPAFAADMRARGMCNGRPRRTGAEVAAEVRRLSKLGLSRQKIAAALEVSSDYVRNIKRKYGSA